MLWAPHSKGVGFWVGTSWEPVFWDSRKQKRLGRLWLFTELVKSSLRTQWAKASPSLFRWREVEKQSHGTVWRSYYSPGAPGDNAWSPSEAHPAPPCGVTSYPLSLSHLTPQMVFSHRHDSSAFIMVRRVHCQGHFPALQFLLAIRSLPNL